MAVKWIDELAIKEEAQARWREDAALRNEFREFPCYLAFLRAQARGLVRIIGTNRVRGGSAQRPVQREDREELRKWIHQTLRTIRADAHSPLTGTKPHTVTATKAHTIRTLDGPRQFGDLDLWDEDEDGKLRHTFLNLEEAFRTRASLSRFPKAKRMGRIKTLR